MPLKSLVLVLGVLLAGPCGAITVQELSSSFENTVTHRVEVPEAVCQDYGQRFQHALADANIQLDHDQFAVLVDRNSKVQMLTVLVAGPAGVQCIGATRVSTGSAGRFDHYFTPTGVFDHTLDNPDFRAEGTRNEHGIRGYGRKGMRIYDMGWQDAIKSWGRPEVRQIRFQLHSTDPDILEPRMGRPDSKGCVRMPATLNTFIDTHGVLDAAYIRLEQTGQTPWVLAKKRVRTGLEGRYVVVVDSGVKQAPDWLGPASRVETAPTAQVELPAQGTSVMDDHQVIDVPTR